MLEELELESHYEQDFEILLKATIEIGNSLNGVKIINPESNIYYAEGIAQKIISHTISAFNLAQGYQLRLAGNLYSPTVDFSSIAVLLRAAIEGYLTFNHVFASPKNENEAQFRFACWHLGGFKDRANFKATTEEQIQKLNYEKAQMQKLREEIKQSSLFSKLSLKEQEAALNGQWRLRMSWADLAKRAMFNSDFFKQQYGFLCSHAHSSRLSIIQVQQTRELIQQREIAKSSIAVLMVVLAKLIYDYIELIPDLHEFKNDTERYPIIYVWKSVGESLKK